MTIYCVARDNDDEFGFYEKRISIYFIQSNQLKKLGKFGCDHDKIDVGIQKWAREENIKYSNVEWL